MNTSKYKFAKIHHNGKAYLGLIELEFDVNNSDKLIIIEDYQGQGWIGQGHETVISQNGYDSWKKGIKIGLEYSYKKLKLQQGLEIKIKRASGLIINTNPTILGYTASRAILNKIEHSETEEEHKQILEEVYSSWDKSLDNLPKFNNTK